MAKNEKIDLVVLWVDGSDIKWQEERARYLINSEEEKSNSFICYRELGLMEYFFRGIEKNAPWINNVFFITWGHLPGFLNTDHPKLKIVNHKDFIPEEYLPTFNSNVIELNLHRIKDLSENFILFNDDFFVIDDIKEEDFFYKNLPCDTLASRTMFNYHIGDSINYIEFNNMGLINRNFYGHKKLGKYISLKYKLSDNMGNLVRLLSKRYSLYASYHLPISHKKSVFEEVWNKEYETLDKMCHNRFRSPYDYSHWLMRYWNLASGNFHPVNVTKLGHFTDLSFEFDELIDIIMNKKEKIFILNDSDSETNEMYELHYPRLKEAFEKALPVKSEYEL